MAISQNKSNNSQTVSEAKWDSGDLEQYGVWVKSEPQDLIEEASSELDSGMESPDFPLDSAILSEAEEKTLHSMDNFGEGTEELIPSFDDISDDVVIDTADLEEPVIAAKTGPAPQQTRPATRLAESSEPSPKNASGSGDFDLSIEDFDPATDELLPEIGEDEIPVISFENEGSDDSSVIDIPIDELDRSPKASRAHRYTAEEASEKPKPTKDLSLDSLEIEEFSVDDFNMDDSPSEPEEFVKAPVKAPVSSKAGNKSSLDLEESMDLSDFGIEDSIESKSKDLVVDDFEPIDIDLQFDDTIPDPAVISDDGESFEFDSIKPDAETQYESVNEFDDFLSGDDAGAGMIPSSPEDNFVTGNSEIVEEKDDFILAEDVPLEKEHITASISDSSNEKTSSDVLLMIVNELASIKNELVSMKSQLAEIKARPESIPLRDSKESEDSKNGFFEEEEDETIALTGDELDNILNTANFVEENSEIADANLDFGTGDLLPENGSYEKENSIELVSLDESSNDIASIARDGIYPMTEAPEDTSFLEAGEEFGSIHEDTLEEPDLSALDMFEVNGADVTEELPSADSPSDLSDMTLDIDHIDADEEIEDLEIVDTMPEIELSSPKRPAMPMFGSTNQEPEELDELVPDFEESDLGEIVLHEDPSSSQGKTRDLADLDNAVIKPSEPISKHPDDIEMNLSDDFFVESPSDKNEERASKHESGSGSAKVPEIPDRLKTDIKSVLSYLDKLLEDLPEEKIEEFAKSDHFETYKKLFEELGLV